ncbi:MAG: hypothetical protein AB1578_23225 [Thermodesulfobacteriota bacterium]
MSKSTEELFYGDTPKTGANVTRSLPPGFRPGTEAAAALKGLREHLDNCGIDGETGERLESPYLGALLEDD